jgi:hypothetical protein
MLKRNNINHMNIFKKDKKYKYVFIGILAILLIIIIILIYRKETTYPTLEMVSGTEYISGEEGQIIIRLQDNRNNPITNADCIVSLLYPDKSFVFIDQEMSPTSVAGNYYYSFTTPEKEGVYEEHTRCSIPNGDENIELKVSDSFHVSTGLNLIVEVSRTQREQYDSLLNTMNDVDSNMQAKMLDLETKVNNMQNYIDNNVMTQMHNINQNVEDINRSIDNSLVNIKQDLNKSIEDNFYVLFNKFKESANAMSNIFNSPE